MQVKKSERISFGRIQEVITPPSLIEIQLDSYKDFLLKHVSSKERSNYGRKRNNYGRTFGLQAVLEETFSPKNPIRSYDEKSELSFRSYDVGEPKMDWLKCLREGLTYSAPLHVTFRLKDEQGTKEEKVYMGEIPLMTRQGTFVINGAERVVVSQLHRSPGVAFEAKKHATSGKILHSFRVIPDRGTWFEAQFSVDDFLFVYPDRKKRKRRFLITTFFRALGYETNADIASLFYEVEEMTVRKAAGLKDKGLQNKVLMKDILDREDKDKVIAHAFDPLSKAMVKKIADSGLKKVRLADISVDGGVIIHCLKNDPTANSEEALKEIYHVLRPGNPATVKNARELIRRMFFDPKRYDLGQVGRYKINQKFGFNDKAAPPIFSEKAGRIKFHDVIEGETVRQMTVLENRGRDGKHPQIKIQNDQGKTLVSYALSPGAHIEVRENDRVEVDDLLVDARILRHQDLIEATKYLIRLKTKDKGVVDDIDHLGSRRVRTVGELLANECRKGLARTERLVKERMTLFDQGLDSMTPHKLVNPKALSAAVRDFFGRSQLSQFMDQTNPLAELTHKRRLSALGPGGLSREHRPGFEVRDVHPSHYGRICPMETPEGANIGLIASLATFARISPFGFVETPYRKVVNGRVTEEVEYLMADREERHIIAPADTPTDDKGYFVNERVRCRSKGGFTDAEPGEVDFIDVSPKQLVSVATGLIPFLEHDDANRALMGANMQRQAVPLLTTEAPLVATGIEDRLARDSLSVTVAEGDGKVASVNGREIIITKDGQLPGTKRKIKHNPSGGVQIYPIRKFMRSNAATCINQKSLVVKGQVVKKGDVVADGPCTDHGELALGKNVLCAFMPWNGYNFEDAILISERIVKDDVFTSIHIDEFEVTARDTKLGPEEITRDIPNLSEEALRNLDLDGVIRVGAEVSPGDILVGKITPKSETELAPEERLLRAIFGEKAADVKDTSLKVPSGTNGIVMDVKISSKKESDPSTRAATSESDKQLKHAEDDHKKKMDELREQLTEALSNILLGEKIPLDVINSETGEIIIPSNRKITKTLLRNLAKASDSIEIDPSPIRNKINEIIDSFKKKFEEHRIHHEEEMERAESGDEVETGVVKSVKVFIASKRKLSVGDKMAGRHGNKGVVAKIVPEEDMPFLADGTPVDLALNPLGVPSRMNVGQVLETHLGWAAKVLGRNFATPVFDGIREKGGEAMKEKGIVDFLKEANLPGHGKTHLYDGRTGERFDQEIVVGYIYMLKLGHLVADKIHSRAVGPYSLVTQQPLGGKAQYGGQRFGEMEVWAMEAYGAAYALQELLTVKSDDVQGRTRIYESIVKGDNSLDAAVPESFNVLVKEIQSLGMNVEINYAHRDREEKSVLSSASSPPSTLAAFG